MKRTAIKPVAWMFAGWLAWLGAGRLEAQTDWSSFPVAPGQSYVISSSPTPDGGSITTTYVPPRSVAMASSLPQAMPAGYGVPTVPAYAPQYAPQYAQQYAQQVPVNPSYPIQYDAMAMPRGYQARTIVPTSYQVPAPGTTVTGPAPPTGAAMTYGTPATANTINPYVGFPVRTVPNSGISTVGYYGTPTNCGMPGSMPANLPPSLGTAPGSAAMGSYSGTYPGMVPIKGTYRPLVPIGKIYPQTYVAQGLIGQPKAFVDGQPVRNFFRYVLP